jgi:putative nucleotidyltransferase with HDIG domain
LASYVDGRRREIVEIVVRSSILPAPGSFTAAVFANGFIERLCSELESGDREALDAWADSESDPQEAFEHSRIVVVACDVIGGAYASDCGESDEVNSYLVSRAGELEKRFRIERRAKSASEEADLVSRDEVVNSILSALEVRDASAYEHSRAVGMWCSRIAKTLGLSPEQQAFAGLAGTLHDVGKIATPAEILLKPSALQLEEWESMRAHSQIGAKMLERIPSLKDVAPIVRAHHERVDGRGYPDGLASDAIPFVARIVAVADAFHAMISKRPYRDGLPVATALDELRAGKGTQFDTVVVEAILEIVLPSAASASRAARALRAVRGNP